MRCPICGDETAGEKTQQWGPEWAHVRCVKAYSLGGCDARQAQREAVAAAVPDVQEGKQFHAKFNIGDHVWYMKDNAPVEVIISAIELFYVGTNQDKITYNAKNVRNSISWLDHTRLPQERLFKSKTELLEAL